jgi:uncharacterized protein YdhG (YjbR/CyaY superfamily)
MKKIEIKTPVDYIAMQDRKFTTLLEKMRATIKKAAPKAEEVMSYGMIGFKYHGVLVYLGAFKNHCSIFAASQPIRDKYKAELKPFKQSKGTIQFTLENPLPLKLVTNIVKDRVKENLDKEVLKLIKKSTKLKSQ